MTDQVRRAVARLTTDERAMLTHRWTENAVKWSTVSPALGQLWDVLATLVHEVDVTERARATGHAQAGLRHHTRGTT